MDWFASYQVGNTPLVPLRYLNSLGYELFAKLEWCNPSGSVKDRAAWWMIKEAEKNGLLKDSKIIIEPTSGNTGISLQHIAKIKGYQFQPVFSYKVSEQTKAMLKNNGNEVFEVEDDMCPRVGSTDQAIALAEVLVKNHPEKYFMPDQYKNEANFMAHYETTGPEIWRDTNGKIKHFVAGIGTGGTVTGVGQYLKKQNPNVKIYAVQPQSNHNIQGLRNLKESLMPELLKRGAHLIDEWVEVSDDEAFLQVRRLAEEKLFVGPSSGAVLAGALKIIPKNEPAVVLFADDGSKYKDVYTEFNVLTDEEFDILARGGALKDK